MPLDYRLTANNREGRPRSKRLRQLGVAGTSGGGSVVTINASDSPGAILSHTHSNKAALDQIGTDRDGYGYLTRNIETENPETGQTEVETVTGKVKAGYADMAFDLTEDSPAAKRFLSSEHADTAEGHIDFEDGVSVKGGATFRDSADFNSGFNSDGLTRHNRGARFGNFIAGASGAGIDEGGNAEVESLTSRSWLKVRELIYNRLNALEGDTSFSDSGTIESLSGSGRIATAYMRRRWDGDFTTFQPGDIVYGYVNNIDGDSSSDTDGYSLLHYRAWAVVGSVNRETNALRLTYCRDTEVPGGKNFQFKAGMVISRWGNNIEPTADSHTDERYSSFIIDKGSGRYVNTRQTSFMVSCEEGCLMELVGVDAPVLRRENYGTVLGKIPDGLLDAATEEMLNPAHSYLYARGILVQDLIRIGYQGVTVRTANYRGEWNEGDAENAVTYYRSEGDTYDTVTCDGAMWQCLRTRTEEPPSDSATTWKRMTAGPGRGEKGDDGKDGLMVYPAGVYDPGEIYQEKALTVPVVLYAGTYYRLARGAMYCGDQEPDSRYDTPAKEYANSPAGTSRWIPLEKFDSVFVNIVMADFAKLSSAVFYGDWMLSQQGRLTEADGTVSASSEYERFKDGSFEPNIALNFKTGEISANRGVFAGSIRTLFESLTAIGVAKLNSTDDYTLLPGHYRVRCPGRGETVRLPTGTEHIGARAVIYNYNGTFQFQTGKTTITTEDGSAIMGVLAISEMEVGVKAIHFMAGLVELLCLSVFNGYTNEMESRWCMVTNSTASYKVDRISRTGIVTPGTAEGPEIAGSPEIPKTD